MNARICLIFSSFFFILSTLEDYFELVIVTISYNRWLKYDFIIFEI